MNGNDFIKRDEFSRMDERVSTLDVRQTRTEVRTDHIEDKMNRIESNTTWILRLILGAIITALFGLILM